MNLQETMPVWMSLVLTLVSLGLLFILQRMLEYFFPSSSVVLSGREAEMKRQIDSMGVTIGVLSAQVERKGEIERSLQDTVDKQAKEITSLKKRVAELELEITGLRQRIKKPNGFPVDSLTVLGIWPESLSQPVLDQRGEANALYGAGLDFVELSGVAANRQGLVRELDRSNPKVLEIGCHDDGKGNPVLSDGPTEPGWWGELVEHREILLAVLLYCRSNRQDSLNVADVLIRAGVKYVISFSRPIEDEQAIRFVTLLYEKISEGYPLDQCVQRAKLVVNRQTRDTVVLRTREKIR